MSTPNRTVALSTLAKIREEKVLPHQCRVCGVPAEFAYYGVIVCQPCKVFFRRNATAKKGALLCDYDDRCDINVNNRHVCTACRLAKCFQCGMASDKFRAPLCSKSKSKSLVKVKSQPLPERFPTLNLLQSDQSLLTTNQWTLLSNLCHGYQESSLGSAIQCLIDTNVNLKPTYVTYEALVDEFLVEIYEITGTYLRSNDDLCKLSTDDRSIMLRSAADNICCIGGAFVMQNYQLYNIDAYLNAMIVKYGKRTMDIHIWARKFIDPDIVLIKLALALFAVCENTCSYSLRSSKDLTDPLIILEIQNKYAEVTWKYLLYRYGHDQAVKRFLNLISWLMAITILICHAQNLVPHINDLHSLVEQVELKLILDDVDQIIQTNS